MMYKIIRQIHMITGMALLIFIVMYVVTGYLLIHEDWFGMAESTQISKSLPLDYTGKESMEAWTSYLQSTYNIRGQIESSRRFPDGRMEFKYFRPGTLNRVEVFTDRASVRITETTQSWQRNLIGFHLLRGYKGGLIYLLWAFIYDISSVAFIIFAVTGIYMWYKLTTRRLVGWIFLAISFSFTGGVMIYLMHAP